MDMKRSTTLAALITITIALPLILLQSYFFVKNEEPLYIWDSKAYWITWQQFASLLPANPLLWWQQNINGIESNDYNPLPVSLLFPFYFLPLASRYAYILALTVCYLLPAVLLVQLTLQRFAGYQSRAWLVFITLAAQLRPLLEANPARPARHRRAHPHPLRRHLRAQPRPRQKIRLA